MAVLLAGLASAHGMEAAQVIDQMARLAEAATNAARAATEATTRWRIYEFFIGVSNKGAEVPRHV